MLKEGTEMKYMKKKKGNYLIESRYLSSGI